MGTTKIVSFRLPIELIEKIDQIKKETGSSKSFIVKKAVEEYYKDLLNKKED